MRIDFDISRSVMLLLGAGGFFGEFIVSIIGLPTNDALIGGSVTLIIAATGASTVVGTARQRRDEDKEAGAG